MHLYLLLLILIVSLSLFIYSLLQFLDHFLEIQEVEQFYSLEMIYLMMISLNIFQKKNFKKINQIRKKWNKSNCWFFQENHLEINWKYSWGYKINSKEETLILHWLNIGVVFYDFYFNSFFGLQLKSWMMIIGILIKNIFRIYICSFWY